MIDIEKELKQYSAKDISNNEMEFSIGKYLFEIQKISKKNILITENLWGKVGNVDKKMDAVTEVVSDSYSLKYQNTIEHLMKMLIENVDLVDRILIYALNISNEKFISSVKLVLKKMLDNLQDIGVLEIQAMGQTFDPKLHQCVEVEVDPERANTVIKVLKRGFCREERVLRYTDVIVGKERE